MDAADIVNRAFSHRHGPWPGMGSSAGRPWGGIVEQVPALWIGWVVAPCRTAGVKPDEVSLSFYGQRLTITSAAMTFGTRYYWRCPLCARRCEAVYATGRVGCRECLHLGYLSQSHRLTSPFRVLDLIFTRSKHVQPRRYAPDEGVERALVTALRQRLQDRIDEIVKQIGP